MAWPIPESGMPATQSTSTSSRRASACAAAVAGRLDVDPFVGRGGVAVVDPEERADLHPLARRRDCLDAVRRHAHDLAGAEVAHRARTRGSGSALLSSVTANAPSFGARRRPASGRGGRARHRCASGVSSSIEHEPCDLLLRPARCPSTSVSCWLMSVATTSVGLYSLALELAEVGAARRPARRGPARPGCSPARPWRARRRRGASR